MVTVLHDNRVHSVDEAHGSADGLRMSVADVERVTGRGADDPAGFVADGQVDVSGWWSGQGRPVLADSSRSVWALGAGHVERAASLASLRAPDFTLPDLAGTPHSLSDHAGKKIFLVSWASW